MQYLIANSTVIKRETTSTKTLDTIVNLNQSNRIEEEKPEESKNALIVTLGPREIADY